jgi:predicted glycoside hydrolase/deacetylase ChbG (UPF0249 family)
LKRLIVTGDDFGSAVPVNEAVERARRLPGLRVGLHLVLVERTPVLPAKRVPDLVGDAGRFHDTSSRRAFASSSSPGPGGSPKRIRDGCT